MRSERKRLTLVCVFTLVLLIAMSAKAMAFSEGEVAQLTERVAQYGPVESVEGVGSTAQAAAALLKSKPPPEGPADVVEFRGHFVDTSASPPLGDKLPAGTVAVVTVGEGFTRLDLLHKPVKLKKLGTPRRFAVPHMARIARPPHQRRARIARWGPNGLCAYSSEPNEHCYAITGWYMTNKGEEVRGMQCQVDTTFMDVFDYYDGARANNECWTAFPRKGEWWMETGTFSGSALRERIDCCQLNWFIAWQKGSAPTYTEIDYVGALPANTYINYSTKYEGNGIWCVWTGPGWATRWNCERGFPGSSTLLEAGAEYADEEKPANSGSVITNFESMQGYYYSWEFDELLSKPGATCASHMAGEPPHGDINFGTC
jgi:hypothetical protein